VKKTFALTLLLSGAGVAGIFAAYVWLKPWVVIVGCITVVAVFFALMTVLAVTTEGRHHAPRKRPVPASVPELPAAAEMETETWDAIPAVTDSGTAVIPEVAHDDTVAITTVVPAVAPGPLADPRPAGPAYGWVPVSPATREMVEEFLGADFAGWSGDDALIRTRSGDPITAHDGDKAGRDEHGVYVMHTGADVPGSRCTAAFPGWSTGQFAAAVEDAEAARECAA